MELGHNIENHKSFHYYVAKHVLEEPTVYSQGSNVVFDTFKLIFYRLIQMQWGIKLPRI